MAYLSDRLHDIFISYAHADDVSSHWVTDFSLHLERELIRLLKIKENNSADIPIKIWKDNLLPQQGDTSKRLDSEIRESSFFLVVMSRSYLISNWCKAEGIMFVESLKTKSKLRIFIVEIEKTSRENWPPFLKTDTGEPLIARPFYDLVDLGQFEQIPMKTPHGSPNPRVQRLMVSLCNDLSNELHLLKHFPPKPTSDRKRIFLAIAPEGPAQKFRLKLKSLLSEKFPILLFYPQKDPTSRKDFENTIYEEMPKCDLFVQVLDASCGLYLSDDPTGFVGHQYVAATNKKRKILQWLHPEIKLDEINEKAYKDFLNGLKNETDGGSLIRGDIEKFTQRIIYTLNNIEEENKGNQQNFDPKSACFVYVKSDIQDQEYAKRVGAAIQENAPDIPIIPLYPASLNKTQELEMAESLSTGIIIIWGKADANWIMREIAQTTPSIKSSIKVGALALCDPVPKALEIEGDRYFSSLKFSSETHPEEMREKVLNYIHKLRSFVIKEMNKAG